MLMSMAASRSATFSSDLKNEGGREGTSYPFISANKDRDQHSFSFTQLLMNGEDWQQIENGAVTSTMPLSVRRVLESSGQKNKDEKQEAAIPVIVTSESELSPSSGNYIIEQAPIARGKGKKRRNVAFTKDASCVTATQNVKNSETNDHQKRQKSTEKSMEEAVKIEANGTEADSKLEKDNSKVQEGSKQDYIHVRARRGQATDSHSLAERVRREKISERMKFLQDLVPGCDKVTGKAMMLDEIINYVQSLQRQVQFLSMKLATVKQPRLDMYTADSLLTNDALQDVVTGFNESQMLQPYLAAEECTAKST